MCYSEKQVNTRTVPTYLLCIRRVTYITRDTRYFIFGETIMPCQILHGYVYEAMFLNTGGALSDRELSGCAL